MKIWIALCLLGSGFSIFLIKSETVADRSLFVWILLSCLILGLVVMAKNHLPKLPHFLLARNNVPIWTGLACAGGCLCIFYSYLLSMQSLTWGLGSGLIFISLLALGFVKQATVETLRSWHHIRLPLKLVGLFPLYCVAMFGVLIAAIWYFDLASPPVIP